MDFTKFVSMLVRKGLFFSRLDKLNDPFEGSLPKLNVVDLEKNVPPEIANNPVEVQEFRDAIKNFRLALKRLRSWTYVSTWHMAEQESAAMWKLYARTEEAVCVRSTYAKLRNFLPSGVFVGRVIYIDYAQQVIGLNNVLWPCVHKRKSFEHERELRAVISDLANAFSTTKVPPDDGVWQDVDLASLIESVYIAPTAPIWFKNTVQDTITQFGYRFPVVRSTLDESPLW
jgi:hypothetical protein